MLHVRDLDLLACELETFPEEICKLVNLDCLDIGDNQLKSLPYQVIDLINLVRLDLSFNSFTEFPLVICQLLSIQSLVLRSNKITKIPQEIGQLRELKYLDLCETGITIIPVEIVQLPKLRHLNVSYNRLSTFPLNALFKLKNIKSCRALQNPFQNLMLTKYSDNLVNLYPLYREECRRIFSITFILISFSKYFQFPACVAICRYSVETFIPEDEITQYVYSVFVSCQRVLELKA